MEYQCFVTSISYCWKTKTSSIWMMPTPLLVVLTNTFSFNSRKLVIKMYTTKHDEFQPIGKVINYHSLKAFHLGLSVKTMDATQVCH